MTTLQKLEKRIRELTANIDGCLTRKTYSFSQADERDLLEEVAKRIKELERGPEYV